MRFSNPFRRRGAWGRVFLFRERRESIRYCLAEAGVTLAGVDHVAVNQDSHAALGRKVLYALARLPSPALVLDRFRNKRRREGLAAQLARAFPGQAFRGRVHAVEHHLAHLSLAFHVSPFEAAAVVSVDGFGRLCQCGLGCGSW